MNVTFKNEIAARVAVKNQKISKTQMGDIVAQVIDEVRLALQNGEIVELRGLGRFSVRARKARPGRHPRTGAKIELPAHKVVHYRPADDLNREFNKRPVDHERVERIKAGVSETRPRFIAELGGTGL